MLGRGRTSLGRVREASYTVRKRWGALRRVREGSYSVREGSLFVPTAPPSPMLQEVNELQLRTGMAYMCNRHAMPGTLV